MGSVVLLELDVTEGRVEVRLSDCGLSLRSVWERAAGLASGAATGVGAVELRFPLVVLLLRLPSSLDWTSRCADWVALIDGGGLLGSSPWLTALTVLMALTALGVLECVLRLPDDRSTETSLDPEAEALSARLRLLSSRLESLSCLAFSSCRLLNASAILSLI